MTILNQIVGHADVDPLTLTPHPKNIHLHPMQQRTATDAAIADIGYIDEILVNRRTGYVINGHLRVELAIGNGDATVPVTYVDVDTPTELGLLAFFDHIGSLAKVDGAKLIQTAELITTTVPLQTMLDEWIMTYAHQRQIDANAAAAAPVVPPASAPPVTPPPAPVMVAVPATPPPAPGVAPGASAAPVVPPASAPPSAPAPAPVAFAPPVLPPSALPVAPPPPSIAAPCVAPVAPAAPVVVPPSAPPVAPPPPSIAAPGVAPAAPAAPVVPPPSRVPVAPPNTTPVAPPPAPSADSSGAPPPAPVIVEPDPYQAALTADNPDLAPPKPRPKQPKVRTVTITVGQYGQEVDAARFNAWYTALVARFGTAESVLIAELRRRLLLTES